MHTLPSLFRNSQLKEHLTALHVSFWRQQWKCADNLSPGKKSVPLWISPVTLLCHCTRSLLQCENSSSLHILIAPCSDHILLSNNNLFPNGWKLMMAEPISARLMLVTQSRSWKAFCREWICINCLLGYSKLLLICSIPLSLATNASFFCISLWNKN